jgi:hypothetical protein
MKNTHVIIFAIITLTTASCNSTPVYLDKVDKSLDDRWNALDNVCRSEPSNLTIDACNKLLILSMDLVGRGCANIYPATNPGDTSHWKCWQ